MRRVSALLVLASGCTLALPYTPSPELCANHLDDDLDGLIDCDDTCAGACPEDDLRACSDARDDDGDGLVDFADPGCWPLASVSLSSCASVDGTDVTYDFDDELWAATPGTLTADPTGMHPGLSFVTSQGAGGTAGTDARQLDVLSGALMGTTAHVLVHLDPDVDLITLYLDVADAIRDVARVRMAFGRHTFTVEASSFDEAQYDHLPLDWYDLALVIESRTSIRIVASRAGVEVASSHIDVSSDAWADAHAFRARLGADAVGTDGIVVGEVRIHREPFIPCGAATPAGLATGLYPLALGTSDGDASVCALGVSRLDDDGIARLPFAPGLARSDDDGITWTLHTHRELVSPSIFLATSYLSGAAFVDGRTHTLLFDPVANSHLMSTGDCAGLQMDGVVPTGADVGEHGYAFDGTTHEIFALAGSTLVSRRWTHGQTGFETLSVADVDDPSRVDRVSRRGTDLIVGQTGIPASLAVVSTGARTIPILRTFAELVGSGRAGACDEYDVRAPLLTIDATPRVAGAAVTGIVVVRCLGRETHTSTTVGFVSQRIVIRAPGT